MTIFLVGPRACGKTRIGGALSRLLNWTSVDTDHFMANDSGLSVAEVVEREGWAGFRRREKTALLRVSLAGRVVSTGGGIVLDPDNISFMRRNGIVFYINTPEWLLVKRLGRRTTDSNRPSLTGKSITEEVRQILEERKPLYDAAAHCILDGLLWPDQVARQALGFMPGLAKLIIIPPLPPRVKPKLRPGRVKA